MSLLPVTELNIGSIDAINYATRKDKEFFSKIFYRDEFLEDILEPKKYFLIGEKGTGKTAYAVLLANAEYRNTTATVNTVLGTDYQKFLHLKEQNQLNMSSYSDIWRVILLLLSASHLKNSESANALSFLKFRQLSEAIEEYFQNAFSPEVVNALEFIKDSGLAAKIMAKHFEASGETKKSEKVEGAGFQTNLLQIEQQFKTSISALNLKKHHIIFIDGIDIRPADIEFNTYIKCISGLAQAVWALNTEYFSNIRDSYGRIKIVLLLRPDIVDSLGYQNTNAKVRDNGIILDWKTTYQNFKTSRIFKLIDGILTKQQIKLPDGTNSTWSYYFPYDLPNLFVAEKVDDPFVGFLRSSYYRPRDIISYLLIMQAYVKQHENDKTHFTERSFRSSLAEYSQYLLGEVKDHLSFYYSAADFDELTGFFRMLKGKNRFNWSDFKSCYDDYKTHHVSSKTALEALHEGPEAFMQFLYALNVVGYDEIAPDQKGRFIHWCFRDRTPVILNPKVLVGLEHKGREAYTVHPGLARALKVGANA